jgi:hypothetical protein
VEKGRLLSDQSTQNIEVVESTIKDFTKEIEVINEAEEKIKRQLAELPEGENNE